MKNPERTFTYKSNALTANSLGDLKVIVYGDQPLNKNGKTVTDSILSEDYDLILILGDMGYDMRNNYGT